MHWISLTTGLNNGEKTLGSLCNCNQLFNKESYGVGCDHDLLKVSHQRFREQREFVGTDASLLLLPSECPPSYVLAHLFHRSLKAFVRYNAVSIWRATCL